jgi:hypothetical protein
MKETNLVLNIDTTKRHAKRLLKVLRNDTTFKLPESFKLSHSQEILSKALGFNNWHELNEAFKAQQNNHDDVNHCPILNTPSSEDDMDIIKNKVIKKLKLSDKDTFIYSLSENDKEHIMTISLEQVFSQYDLLPFLFCYVIFNHDRLKAFFHENFFIHYEKNYHSSPYQIGFKQHNPQMLDNIANAMVELFEIAQEKNDNHQRQFNFSKIEQFYWHSEEQVQQFRLKHSISPPFYRGIAENAKELCIYYLNRSFLYQLDAYELTTIITKLAGEDARILIEPLMDAIFYMSDAHEIVLKIDVIREYLVLDNLIKLYKTRRDFPTPLRQGLKTYLMSLPGFQETAPKQNDTVVIHHGEMHLKLVRAINSLVKIEQEDVPILKTQWWEFIQADSNVSLPNYAKDIKVASRNYFKDTAYVNELWFEDVFDIRGHRDSKSFDRRLGFLFATGKNVYMSDLVKSLYDLSLNSYEIQLVQEFIFAYPRIKKISEKLQQVYLENRES